MKNIKNMEGENITIRDGAQKSVFNVNSERFKENEFEN